MSEKKLSHALEGKFELVGIEPGEIYHPKIGAVDFTTATLKQAEALVEAGSRYIKRIDRKTSTPATGTEGSKDKSGKPTSNEKDGNTVDSDK